MPIFLSWLLFFPQPFPNDLFLELCRYWCSTKVDDDGNHVKTNFGHCNENCSPDLLCYKLHVKVVSIETCKQIPIFMYIDIILQDDDDDYATGVFEANRMHKDKPVFKNKEKDMFIFWISEVKR